MTDREKVIEGQKQVILHLHRMSEVGYDGDVPYYEDLRDKAEDALELLKAQEPRVLTLEEVFDGDECWFEYINGSCGYADVYMQDNKTSIIYRTNIRPGEVPITEYMKKWRCWSYRPTEEQRKEVKWE